MNTVIKKYVALRLQDVQTEQRTHGCCKHRLSDELLDLQQFLATLDPLPKPKLRPEKKTTTSA